MKKKRTKRPDRCFFPQGCALFAKIVLPALIFSCSILQGYSQNSGNAAINLKRTDAKVSDVIKEIERQAGHDMFFETKAVDMNKKITVDLSNATLTEAVRQVFGPGFSHSIVDNMIVIQQRSATGQQPARGNIRVTGQVFDKSNAPLIGATVKLKGQMTATMTDVDGKFELNVPAADQITLEVSFVGKVAQEVVWTGSPVKVVLQDDTIAIEDVVVNGIFERKANTFTGSVTTLKNEDLKRVSNSNVLQSLKNLDPSIMFFDNMELGSDPNAMPQMALRGKSNLVLDDIDLKATYQYDPNAPLFILDGFEVSIQKVLDLDMNRVESLTILKDASAKAIYGSKAANGVIVIELKKNTSGRPRITYNGSVEVQVPDLSSYNLTSAAEKLEIEDLYGIFYDENGGVEQNIAMNKLYNQRLSFVQSGINTDWMSKPLKTGVGTKHGVSVELGDRELRSIIDLSYNDVKGVMRGSDRTTISGGVSLSYRHKNLLFRNQFTINSNTSHDSKYGSFDQYTKLNPYYTPYDSEGNLAENIIPQIANFTGQSVTIKSWYEDVGYEANPLYDAQLNTVLKHKYINFTNNFDLQWQIIDALRLTARVGLMEQRDHDDKFYPSGHSRFKSFTNEDAFRKGSYTMSEGRNSTLTGKLDIQYNKVINNVHNFYLNAGFDLSQRSSVENTTEAEGFPSDKMTDIMFARQYMKDRKPTGNEQTVHEVGYYASLSYSFDDRINADVTFRQNASSMYGADSRWGMFWSTGVSWNIHNEKWMQGGIFDQLRLRASIGSTGSQSSAAYNAIATYNYYLDRNYEGMLGTTLGSMHNPGLKWQDKLDKNLGIDLSINRKIMLTLEYYNSLTNNALNPITLAPSTGFNTVSENVGKIRNEGLELRATWVVWQRPEDRSSFSVNVAALHNKNVLSEVSDAMRTFNAQQNEIFNKTYQSGDFMDQLKEQTRPVNKYYDGVSMDAIWAVRSLGIDPANGMEIYMIRDKDGNFYRSYNYDANSQIICGDNLPKVQGNVGFSFNYKGFGLNLVMRYQWGGQMYNTTLVQKVENANIRYNVDRRMYTDRWRNPGDQTQFKRIRKTEVSDKNNITSDITQPTSRFVQDRNELTISSVRISYDFFRLKFLKKIGMERMILALNANDVYTFSSIRIERGTSYPFARTFNGSLTFTF